MFIFNVRAAISHIEMYNFVIAWPTNQQPRLVRPTPDEAEVGVTLTLRGFSLAIC
jgi:hypothetical protein